MIFGDTLSEKSSIAAWLFVHLMEYTDDEMRQSVARVSSTYLFEPILLHALGGVVLDYTSGFDQEYLDSACLVMQRALLLKQTYNIRSHKIDVFGSRLVPLLTVIRENTPDLKVQERMAEVICEARRFPYSYFRYDGQLIRQWIRDAGIKDSDYIQDEVRRIEDVGEIFAAENMINTLHCIDAEPFDMVNSGIVGRRIIIKRGLRLIDELMCGYESIWRHDTNGDGRPVMRLMSARRGRAFSTRVCALGCADEDYSQRVHA